QAARIVEVDVHGVRLLERQAAHDEDECGEDAKRDQDEDPDLNLDGFLLCHKDRRSSRPPHVRAWSGPKSPRSSTQLRSGTERPRVLCSFATEAAPRRETYSTERRASDPLGRLLIRCCRASSA